MIERLQKSVPTVIIVCPFIEKYTEQHVNFKVCIFCVFIFFYQTNIELPAGYFACSDFDYIYKQESKLDCSLLKGHRLGLPCRPKFWSKTQMSGILEFIKLFFI